jgi:hypothetical protein
METHCICLTYAAATKLWKQATFPQLSEYLEFGNVMFLVMMLL